MGSKQPTTPKKIETLVSGEISSLHPAHIARFAAMRVTPRRVSVTSTDGEYVYAIAEYQGKVLYYSDFEEAWGLAALDNTGGIADPASNSFQLSHIMNQLFGIPNIRTCRGGH